MNAFLYQTEPLHDAETVLLVDNGEAQLLEFHVLFEQRVGTHHHVRQPLGHQALELNLFPVAEASREQRRYVSQLRKDLPKVDAVQPESRWAPARQPDSRFRSRSPRPRRLRWSCRSPRRLAADGSWGAALSY